MKAEITTNQLELRVAAVEPWQRLSRKEGQNLAMSLGSRIIVVIDLQRVFIQVIRIMVIVTIMFAPYPHGLLNMEVLCMK